MEITHYKNLLEQVSAVNARYKKIDELTGDNFNIFRILKVESYEVKVHSRFIAELLNPKGSHGQKDIFLKLFTQVFCFKQNEIDTASCKVKVEDYIGLISEARDIGGRLDISITDKFNNKIIIENKIYAGDQPSQLMRYYNHANDADLIYLTLLRQSPSDDSKRVLEENKHYKCFSYKDDILKWLELCRKEVAINPIIREGITHYINLIKHLTGQTINNNMQEELTNLIKLNLEASFAIVGSLDKTREKISNDFGKELTEECDRIGLTCEYNINFKSKYNGFDIYKPDWEFVVIRFQFWNYDSDMVFGMATWQDPIKSPIPINLRNQLITLGGIQQKNNSWWPCYQKLEAPFNNWQIADAYQALLDGRMQTMVMDKVEYLLKMTKEINL